MGEPVTSLLRRALRLVEARRPEAYAALVADLDGLELRIAVEDELVLRSEGGLLCEVAAPSPGVPLRLVEASLRPAIRVRADRRTVQALVDGRMTLMGALRGGSLDVAGTVGALGRGIEAFEGLVSALLRIDEAEGLREGLEDG